MSAVRKPEIMSPAGHWPQLRAAIEAGADSVYFGLKHFSARAKVGFSLAELPDALRTLHQRGVKGFVTFNTLVFDHEVAEAASTLEAIAHAGADAIIVQDIGMVKLAKQIAPGLEIHGSTQMSITSAHGVRLAQQFGVSRVTLARELSLDEVRAIRAATDCELEIFVHGALCVAYSGQCFSSEAWGGRSANRGQCAQACRLPYEMMVDGHLQPLADARYLLSPGDLYALKQMPEIVQIGISALKIEGRYKDADYVALTTRAYRQAVDEAWAGQALSIDRATELQLEQVYSRGLGPFFLGGTNHQAVVQGRAPRHRGVLMGSVARVTRDSVLVETGEAHTIAPLKPGDGVVFDAAGWRSPEEPEEGGRIFQVARQEGKLELRFGNGVLNPSRIRRGDLVWRTHDPNLDKVVRPYLEAATPIRKQPVHVKVTAREGQPLQMEWSVPTATIRVESAQPLSTASNRTLTAEFLREQLGRLGNTPYELATLVLQTEGAPFAPSSLLNHLRREAVESLQATQAATRPLPPGIEGANRSQEAPPASRVFAFVEQASACQRPLAGAFFHSFQSRSSSHSRIPGNAGDLVAGTASEASRHNPSPQPPLIHLLVRTPEQLDAALTLRPASITLDYLDLYGLKPSLDRVRAAGLQARVASPRVLKPGEERITDFLLSCGCPILVRSTGLLEALRAQPHPALVGDFSLNAANEITAAELLSLGISLLTPTHDLNAAQVAELARRIGPEQIEAVVYQHLPVFHTEHCVFCRFLSTGTSYRDCGRPCEEHRVALRDSAGRAHPVLADVGCRNTVFGAEAQQAGAHLEEWRAAGIHQFRLEFAHESAEQVTRVTRAFEDVMVGRSCARDLAQQLARIAPQGVTEGSLFVPEGYLTLPVLQ
ncbi:Peptidase U32 [Candidatus Sulfopaludibacter sp. SbA3]|nr:Peptidase U32 [Candidatus Sulfopaludibacter sp. SbA3]